MKKPTKKPKYPAPAWGDHVLKGRKARTTATAYRMVPGVMLAGNPRRERLVIFSDHNRDYHAVTG